MDKKNLSLAINLAMVAIGMLGMAYASVPLYNLFCRVTGYGGTTQIAAELPTDIREREITVRFNADIDSSLNWEFHADQIKSTVKIGENGLAYFTVKNLSDKDEIGMATYNVTPTKAGRYFFKVYCFCFDEQVIKAGETVQYPVSYYIEPAFDDDEYMDDVDTITLSYTFYAVKEKK
ncbi:MAG: cytochrome c oxidase assembly protein [Alphaproteobacteria bacterium CG11_big_fil_rev_8_21_14_0_20_44_7]|nr:MAG: cytochrome c oxidase assembly protein [Alphaproteobacteria bacterium CG11_big_fil_rev_8_21_14_0_20_44_7]